MLPERYPPLRDIRDIEELERVPFDTRVETWDFGGALLESFKVSADRWALHYVSDGDPGAEPRSMRYGELRDHAVRVANLFHAEGIRPEDTVVFVAPTVPELVIGLAGAFCAARAFPLNWMLSAENLCQLIADVEARAIVTLGTAPQFDIREKLESVRAKLPPDTKLFTLAGPDGRREEATDLLSRAAEMCDAGLAFERSASPDETLCYLHSGGTTGAPKIIALSQRGFAYRRWATNHTNACTSDETVFLDGPMFHVGGLLMRGFVPLSNGQTGVIPSVLGARDRRYIANYWKFVERFGVTRLSGVPTTLSVLLSHPPSGEDVSSLRRHFPTGSTPVPRAIQEGVEASFGIRPLIMYGMTENTGNMTLDPRDGPTRPGSVGIRLPYTELRSVQIDSNRIVRDSKPGEVGTIVYRSPGVTTGYLDARYNETGFVEGWVNSGDLGRIDADGYVWLVGRAKDVIIRGGHNIDPAPIEEAFARLPEVELAAVVGMPDSHAGEVPVIFIQLREGAVATSEELLRCAEPAIPERPAVPKRVFIVDELPLTGVGKPRKVELRCRATRVAVEEALARKRVAGVSAVTVAEDPDEGIVATITLRADPAGACEAGVAEALSPFAFAWRCVPNSKVEDTAVHVDRS